MSEEKVKYKHLKTLFKFHGREIIDDETCEDFIRATLKDLDQDYFYISNSGYGFSKTEGGVPEWLYEGKVYQLIGEIKQTTSKVKEGFI
jgi:hypothetical protein